MSIDFRPDSAPLAGIISPTAEHLAALQQASARVSWLPPAKCSSVQAQKIASLTILGIFLYSASYLPATKYLKSRISKGAETSNTQSSEKKHPPQPIPYDTARSIQAVLQHPSQEQINQLFSAYKRGSAVQLITPVKFSSDTGFKVYPVAEGSILRSGFLIDGCKWFDVE